MINTTSSLHIHVIISKNYRTVSCVKCKTAWRLVNFQGATFCDPGASISMQHAPAGLGGSSIENENKVLYQTCISRTLIIFKVIQGRAHRVSFRGKIVNPYSGASRRLSEGKAILRKMHGRNKGIVTLNRTVYPVCFGINVHKVFGNQYP